MPTGLDIYDALKEVMRDLPVGEEVQISRGDADDLCKLTSEELLSRGCEESTAERISAELLKPSFTLLGQTLGHNIVVSPSVRTLVPVIRLRETAGSLADEPETLEETFRILDEIRHPERYAS